MSIFGTFFGGNQNQQQQQQPNVQQPSASGKQPGVETPADKATADGKMPGTDQLPVNPLDAYTKLWDTAANTPEAAPTFSLDPKVLDTVSGQLNFTQGMDQDLLTKATNGDAGAMLQIINQVGQQSYKAALSHGSALTDKFVGARSQFDLKGIGSKVKSELVSTGFSDIPNASHPAVKTELTRIAKAMQAQNPEATPDQIVQATKEYFSTVFSAANPNQQANNQQQQQQAGEVDWDKYFD